jgi:2-hydroxychromene-2-carboxylate isomerase
VRELCERRGTALTIQPVLFAGLLNHWGQLGPAEIPPKALFVFKSCARSATLAGIPFRVPRFHPFNPLTALRVSLREVAGADQPRVIDALFAAGWGRGEDLGSPAVITEALDGAGLDGRALVERAADPAVKETLRAATARAVERGVFGIPTMIANGELFWGNDQLEHVERRLDGADPLDALDFSVLAPTGRGAERRRH